ncbi:MAG: hypothetical protein GY696_22380 [Gammaproteobacteria bacterium]|nr:hypothetical protein [Gammaproteobacteria bacterium]
MPSDKYVSDISNILKTKNIETLKDWNFFQVTSSGDLEAFIDYMECQGEEFRHGDKLVENKVVLLELRFMVRDEHFIINHAIMESQTEHLQLPCSAGKRLLDVQQDIYLARHSWRLPPPPCEDNYSQPDTRNLAGGPS